jgi:hypothetical protein
MSPERYILVVEATAGADVGRDVETDVAIEDDGNADGCKDNWGAKELDSRRSWISGDEFVDGSCDAGTGAVNLFVDDGYDDTAETAEL